MARNALGQYTRRASRRRSTRIGPRFLGAGPLQGTEENGVVTGDPIVLGGETAPARETAKAAKS